ncbi:MAG TPA: phosphate signaling complex protein PhoU [Thermomicrobiales bacterium]|nr:phosphate signaling complex protein PhoU [Thermomicrobiales bacterium]
MTREMYQQQIGTLRNDVVAMSSMVEKAIAHSVQALRERDVLLARKVIAGDLAINAKRWQIEECALLLIATQAPVAGDLRKIAAVIHTATELERMADHAAGNAKIVILTADQPLIKPLVDIPRMAQVAREMLAESIRAFIAADEHAARAVVQRDDEVDALYNQVYRELLTYMMADPATIDAATHLLWVAHNLERIADRVTNVCERVVFAVTGVLEELAVASGSDLDR